MNHPNLLPTLIVPFREKGSVYEIDVPAFAGRLISFVTMVRAKISQAHFANAVDFLETYARDEILRHTPVSLQNSAKGILLPVVENVLRGRLPVQAAYSLFVNFAIGLNSELAKQLKQPDFSKIPRQEISSVIYMGLPECFFISKTTEPFYGCVGKVELPGEAWTRQIREASGWRALRDLVKHVGAEVRVLEPDSDVMALNANYGVHTPYSKMAFVRDKALLIDDTAYMMAYRASVNTEHYTKIGREDITVLGENFRRFIERENFKFRPIHHGINGGNVIYDPVNHVLFVGGITLNDTQRFFELAAKEASLRAAIPQSRIIPIPLTDPGLDLDPARRISVKEDGRVVQQTDLQLRFYDLDTILTVDEGRIAMFPSATTPTALDRTRGIYGAGNITLITDEAAALRYPLNVQSVGNVAISNYTTDQLRAFFGHSGKMVVTPEDIGLPADSFLIGLGSVRCMTNTAIHSRPRLGG